LRGLIALREPTYALADITVHSREVPHDAIVNEIVAAMAAFLNIAVAPPRKDGA
jgi:shikimate kinase